METKKMSPQRQGFQTYCPHVGFIWTTQNTKSAWFEKWKYIIWLMEK